MKLHSALLSCCLVLCWACSNPPKKTATLGELVFDITSSEAARPSFEKGLLLMHSFEFADAAEAFRVARKADPECAMAYWGEAMTYNHAIWQEQDYGKGTATLALLDSVPSGRVEKAKTDMEKDFMRAVNILYGEGTKIERDRAYADFMASLYKKYPESHEVAAFYALSLLGSVPVGRNDSIYQSSARISEKILGENPHHPGALHYLIHANDDPYHAKAALPAANEYSQVAPDAAHALHMPTHIYVALGMWDEVVKMNEQSWQASVTRKEQRGLTNDALGYHSFHWLEYGYLQKGRTTDALRLVNDMVGYCAGQPSGRARAHEIYLKSTYLVETNDWNAPLALHRTDPSGLNISTRAIENFVRGMKLFQDGDTGALRKLIDGMKDERLAESAKVSKDGIALCATGGANRENTSQLDIDQLHVIEMQLEGLLAWKQRNLAAADRWLSEAAGLESRISYSYGPPSIVKPSHELYGDYLLEARRPDEAMKAFDAALKRAPRRVLALKGKMKAAEMLNLADVVSAVEKELREISS